MGFGVMPGMVGILVTCNKGREAVCVKEVYDLLSEHFDDKQAEADTGAGPEIEDALAHQIQQLKSRKNKPFLSIGLGKDLGCLVFIKLANDCDPVPVVGALLDSPRTGAIRSTQRLVPLQAICYANVNDFAKMARSVVKAHLLDHYNPATDTFAVVVESRMNSSLDKRVLVELLGEMVGSAHGFKVCLKAPTVCVMVQVVKNIAGLAIIPAYYERHKMNAGQFVGAAVLLRDYVGELAFCSGESMQPTLNASGDVVLVEKMSVPLYRRRPHLIKRGDIVVCYSPQDPNKTICKRVIGRPGELVWSGFMAERVPAGHVWLEGDNKAKSNDSRAFGPVPISSLQGRVIMKVWPPMDFGTLL